MRIEKLRKKALRQVRREYRRGKATALQLSSVEAICADPVALKELHRRVENEINPWNRPADLYGMDWRTMWANLKDWFVANWPQILALIMKLLPLLLLEPKHEDR
jgi:hypothetical protein